MSIYVVDTNFFIEAHRAYYPFDVVPSFWNKIKQLADDGKIISIDKVKNEIYDNNDKLEQWCKSNLPKTFFKDSTQVISSYQQAITWATSRSNHYLPNALAEFLDADEADAHIIAYVLANKANLIVVTQETSEPNRKNKIKIPDACIALNVRYVNVITMFRQLGETF